MTAKSKAPKAGKVIVTAPKIEMAYRHVTEVTAKGEHEIATAINALHVAIKGSKLSTADVEKALKANTTEGTILKFSHVEGLATWAEMRSKFAEFKALPIAKQLSTATASYKLLGATAHNSFTAFDKLTDGIKEARKLKNNKAKEPKDTKAPKEPTSAKAVLAKFLEFVNALDVESVTTKEAEIMQEISMRLMEFETIDA